MPNYLSKVNIDGVEAQIKDEAAQHLILNLQNDLRTEKTDRENADNALQEKISKIVQGKIIDVTNVQKNLNLESCTGDGNTDDITPLQNIVNFASNNGYVVYLPCMVRISTPLIITKSVTIIGCGSYNQNLDESNDFKKALSGLKCDTNGIEIRGRVFNVFLSNFCIWGSWKPSSSDVTIGLDVDRLRSSYLNSIDILFFHTGMKLQPKTSQVSDDNIMFTTFERIGIIRTNTSMKLDGNTTDSLVSNVCHCTFIGLYLDFYGGGIILNNCDNNAFYDTNTYQRGSSTTWSLVLNDNARSNYFYHFQGRVTNNTKLFNAIYDLDCENGQKTPYDQKFPSELCFTTSDGVRFERGFAIFTKNSPGSVWEGFSLTGGLKLTQSYDGTTGEIGKLYSGSGNYDPGNWIPFYNGVHK